MTRTHEQPPIPLPYIDRDHDVSSMTNHYQQERYYSQKNEQS